MAVWAERMTWATWATVVLTVIGLFLIWRTLGYTKKAAIYTKDAAEAARASVEEARKGTAVAAKAADAALKANELNRENFVADKRAWMTIRQHDITVISPLTWNEQKEGHITIQVITENIGRNLAYNVWYDAAISIGGAT